MTEDIDRVSLWADEASPRYDIAGAVLVVEDDFAQVRVSDPTRHAVGLPNDVRDWGIVASRNGAVRFSGTVHHTSTTVSVRGTRFVFYCLPAETE